MRLILIFFIPLVIFSISSLVLSASVACDCWMDGVDDLALLAAEVVVFLGPRVLLVRGSLRGALVFFIGKAPALCVRPVVANSGLVVPWEAFEAPLISLEIGRGGTFSVGVINVDTPLTLLLLLLADWGALGIALALRGVA